MAARRDDSRLTVRRDTLGGTFDRRAVELLLSETIGEGVRAGGGGGGVTRRAGGHTHTHRQTDRREGKKDGRWSWRQLD